MLERGDGLYFLTKDPHTSIKKHAKVALETFTTHFLQFSRLFMRNTYLTVGAFYVTLLT